jgi:hypothetical protein
MEKSDRIEPVINAKKPHVKRWFFSHFVRLMEGQTSVI